LSDKTENSRLLHTKLLEVLQLDIAEICETHLEGNQILAINGYQWFGNNRKTISNQAWRGSGGVGFIVSNKILDNFDCVILDNSCDDILWISLKCKYDLEFVVNMCVCYLQPEHSCRGNIAQEFYDTLLSQMYLYSNASQTAVCGDFNGRIGDKQDIEDIIDYIPARCCIDTVKNSFGDYFLEFLKDAHLCKLNGRINSEDDNYTFVSPTGKSVVDYIAVPYTDFKNCSNFEVKLISDIMTDYDIHPAAGATIPDHSVLICELTISNYLSARTEKTDYSQNHENETRRVYNVSSIPIDIFNNERCARAITTVTQTLENYQNRNDEIDVIYKEFVDLLHDEMDKHLTQVKT